MDSPDFSIPEEKVSISTKRLIFVEAIISCSFLFYLAMTIWHYGLKHYVNDADRVFIEYRLSGLFFLFSIWLIRELAPVLIGLSMNIYYREVKYPKLLEAALKEYDAQQFERLKREYVESAKAAHKKSLKQYGEPINLKKWVGKRADSVGKGYVYVLKDIEISHFYKIGKTRKPYERMRAFGVHLPFDVELIHVIECDNADAVERHMHERFADCRRKGEWFDLQPYHIDWLKQYHELNAQ